MKNSMVLKSLVAGATMLTGSAFASEPGVGAALAPTPATADVVSSFVDRYAVREFNRKLRNPSTDAAIDHATDVTLYPTADREVVFVSFRIAGADRIALAETHGGRVTRFTDFAGERPRHVSASTADFGDAQAQARSILSPKTSVGTVTSTRAAQENQRTGAQAQAADVLQFASERAASAAPSQIATHNVPRSVGDSLQMARNFINSSSGR
jgi:hypothetical protein